MATSSSTIGQGINMKHDSNSPIWRYVTPIQQIPGGGGFIWICFKCKLQFKGSYSRVIAHLCGVVSQGIRVWPGPDGKGLPRAKTLAYIKGQEDTDAVATVKSKHPLLKKGSSSRGLRPPVAPNPDVVGSSHPFLSTPMLTENDDSSIGHKRTKSGGPLQKAFHTESRDIADQKIDRFLYACGISFNVVRSPYWRDAVRAINDAPKGYTSPGYEKVRTTLLSKERKHVEDQLQPIRDSWSKTGVSIIFDGWKDTANRPLINVVAVCPKGAKFLRAIDCEGQVKDSQFIANIIIESIEAVGAHKVVQVITDNAKNCRAAGMLVEERYGHIFWTPCAVHSINLMLQKLGTKIAWIKDIYEEASEIQMFVSNHHMSQAIFRSFSKLQLLKVAETRFASHTLVLRRLVKVKDALSGMVISSNWGVWKNANTERATKIKLLILDDAWWERVEYLLSFTEPILSMLRFADMDHPCLGEIYDGIDSMIESIKSIINEKEKDPTESFFKEVQTHLIDRWNKMTTPLHLLAFSLTPKYYSAEILSLPRRVAPYKDLEVSEGCKVALTRLFPDPELHDAVRKEFVDFISSRNQSIIALRDKYKMDGYSWWFLHGQAYPNLQTLAIKMLAQVASSSSAERNWGTYSFIHSVNRNKLGAKKAEDLVFVHSNLRLLTHKQEGYKRGETKCWDVDPETPNLDASIAHLSLMDLEPEGEGNLHEGASESGTACGSNELQESSIDPQDSVGAHNDVIGDQDDYFQYNDYDD